jgi:predicted metal-binding protein
MYICQKVRHDCSFYGPRVTCNMHLERYNHIRNALLEAPGAYLHVSTI